MTTENLTGGSAAVRATGIWKRYGRYQGRPTSLKERIVGKRSYSTDEEFWPLRDISFTLPHGGGIGLVGHNGAGKSTALKVLAGIYRPTRGRLELDGRVSSLLELGAGFHPDLTGRENIRLNGAILGLSAREIAARTQEIIEFSGVAEFIEEPVKVYSSGMRIRLAFAISVAIEPDILVVDEIIAVGDERFKRQCYDYMTALRERGAALIMASHALSSIATMCDTAIWLDHGRARMIGPSAEVVAAYQRDAANAPTAVTR